MDRVYSLLQNLTLPVIALTTSAAGRRNGMISNSAQRASLVTSIARISVYISKTNFTHDLVHASGVFGIHLLRTDQWELIRHLGLQSGRDSDKLGTVATREGTTGCPMLADAVAGFECRVVNVMDTGASTFFLADIVDVVEGSAGPLMTSDYFRTHIPDGMRQVYEAHLAEAQRDLEELSRQIVPSWSGPSVAP